MDKYENFMAIGVDIGGSHITAAQVDLQKKIKIHHTHQRAEINPNGTVSEIIGAWANVIKRSCGYFSPSNLKIGIAFPGPCDYEKGICLIEGDTKFKALYELNVIDLLAEELKITPDKIRLQNDACAFLKGEIFSGAGEGYKRAMGVTLGTGLGTSTCTDGRVHDADLWRMPFKGKVAEDFISTRWFVERYKELSGNLATGVEEISNSFTNDDHAKIVYAEFANNLTDFLVKIIMIKSPDVIVIGGNINRSWPLFFPKIIENFKMMSIHVPIKRATLGEDAAILGASSLWLD